MKRTHKGSAWAASLAFVMLGCGDAEFGSGGRGGMFQAAPEPEPEMRFGVIWEDLVVDSGKVASFLTLYHSLFPFIFSSFSLFFLRIF